MADPTGTFFTFSSLDDNEQIAFQTTGNSADFLSSDQLSFSGLTGFEPIHLQFIPGDAPGGLGGDVDTDVDDLVVFYDNGVDPAKIAYLLDTTLGELYQNIVGSDLGSFFWVGNNGASGLDDDGSSIFGTNHGDYIAGLGGNDTISALGGDDRIDMASGANGEYGMDSIDGGLGSDLISFGNGMASGVTVHLGTGTVTGGAANSGAALTSIESVFGTVFNDSLTGNGLANTLDGGTAGNDTLNGGAGNDDLIGDAGNDLLNGGSGGDFMDGGAGNDIYTMDSLSDVVVEAPGQGIDTIRSTAGVTLPGNVEKLLLTGDLGISGDGNALRNTLTGNESFNRLRGFAANDTISGAGDNDDLIGGNGNDLLTGGTGADNFVFDFKLNAATNLDTILDFSRIEGDKIQLDRDIFTKLGPISGVAATLLPGKFSGDGVAHDSNDFILYNPGTGALSYDRDGNGGGFAAVQFATVTGSPALVASDLQYLVVL